MRKCPTCGGKGYITNINYKYNYEDHVWESQENILICPTCNGTGFVDEDKACEWVTESSTVYVESEDKENKQIAFTVTVGSRSYKVLAKFEPPEPGTRCIGHWEYIFDREVEDSVRSCITQRLEMIIRDSDFMKGGYDVYSTSETSR